MISLSVGILKRWLTCVSHRDSSDFYFEVHINYYPVISSLCLTWRVRKPGVGLIDVALTCPPLLLLPTQEDARTTTWPCDMHMERSRVQVFIFTKIYMLHSFFGMTNKWYNKIWWLKSNEAVSTIHKTNEELMKYIQFSFHLLLKFHSLISGLHIHTES